MTTELWILVAVTALCLALPLVYMPLYIRQAGHDTIAGNREGAPEPAGAAGRGLRAHRNLLENLLPFGIAVLLARALGVSDTLTVAGAWLFLVARVAHAAFYLAGIQVARTLAYAAGVVGTVLILTQLH
ncbi:MAG: MAPEG family protein [Betaproteobacteria bacterium]